MNLKEKLEKRDRILVKLLKEEGYETMDEIVKKPFTTYLSFRNKLFKRYHKAGV